jgi:hypothetical protein
MDGLTEFALFQVKFYLMEKSIFHKDPELQQYYRHGAMLISRMTTEINDRHVKEWRKLKGE